MSFFSLYFGMINNPYGNIGKVENKGIEMSVSYANSWRDCEMGKSANQFMGK